MSVTTPSTGQKISDFSVGTVDANSYLIQARNGSTEKVTATQIGQYSNLNLLFSGTGGLDTTNKTIVGAINEVNAKDASDIAYDNTASGMTATDVQSAIDEVSEIQTNSPTSVYGTFTFSRYGKIKSLQVGNVTGLASGLATTLDFTIPSAFLPSNRIQFDLRIPQSNDTIRVILRTDGTISIYNYTTITGSINVQGSQFYF